MSRKLQFDSDRYKPKKLLGRGGMGRVLLADDLELSREVAIKVMSPKLRENQGAFARFHREARIQARIEHPNVLKIFDWDLEAKEPYLVMEVVRGRDMDQILKDEGPFSPDQLLRLARELGAGLDALHAQGVLHRDLKPANIMIRDDGSAVVMDLGLAKADDMTVLTKTGSMIGTPRYFPPELFQGGTWVPASDQFQMGAILFDAITGTHLVQGKNIQEVAKVIATGAWAPFPERDPPLAPSIRAGILRSVSLDPEERFESCTALANFMADRQVTEEMIPVVPDLQEVLAAGLDGPAGMPPQEGKSRVGAAIGLGLLLVVGLGVGWTSGASDGNRDPGAVHSGAADTSPLGPGFVLDAEDELAGLSNLRLEAGEVFVGAEGGGGPGDPLLTTTPDPALLPKLLVHLPRARRFHQWIGGGGDPATLPEEMLEKLREIDRDYKGKDLLPVFHPATRARPEPGEVEVPATSQWPEQFPRPEKVSGWLGQAFREQQALFARLDRMRADLKAWNLERSSDFPEEALAEVASPIFRAKRFAREDLGLWDLPQFLGSPVGRLALLPWMRESGERARAMVYALGRSVRNEPETAALVPFLLGVWYGGVRFGFNSSAWSLPLEFHLAGPIEGPDQELLAIQLLYCLAGLNNHSLTRPDLMDELGERVGRLLGETGRSELDLQRVGLALNILYGLLGRWSTGGSSVPDLFDAHLPTIENLPPIWQTRVLSDLARMLEYDYQRKQFPPDFEARLRREMLRLADGIGTDELRQRERGQLENVRRIAGETP